MAKTTNEEQNSSDQTKAERREAHERRMAELRSQQGLGENAVPEQRDLRYRDTPDSAIVNKLREAGDTRGGQTPPMDFDAYERANSDAQMKKAEEASRGNLRFFPGARGWVDNPGAPDHGRAVGILGVAEYESVQDELLDKVQGGRGKAKAYLTESRDGRAEKLTISAEHFRPALNEAEWGKTPTMTPIPDGT